MNMTQRSFPKKSILASFACMITLPALSFSQNAKPDLPIPTLKRGEKQIFVDDLRIGGMQGASRVTHPAKKLEHPVLRADVPWEQKEKNGAPDNRINIYGTVLRDEDTGVLRMWYNNGGNVLYATSTDGIQWERPNLNIVGETNKTNLKLHCPSIIYDKFETDPKKRYKAVGSFTRNTSEAKLQKLKDKFEIVDWYKDTSGRLYHAAYSADGLHWTYYPEPILLGCDTITLSQDPVTGEYLAFHKRLRDPRVKMNTRQVFLATSKDMENWTEPVPVMVADEIDDAAARQLPGGTHSEFYNMSAFPYGGQWLGLVTHFRRTETPGQTEVDRTGPDEEKKKPDTGIIDVQLTHSRDGRNWSRCSDRSPVIPLGPCRYDSGSIFGLCNSPVIVGDEMWMYYTAVTTPHGGHPPEKEQSIARAAWRIDGLVSLQAKENEAVVETTAFIPEGKNLIVNADAGKGRLMIEALDAAGKVIKGFEKESCIIENQDSTKLAIQWKNAPLLPEGEAIRLKFYLKNGDLYSYAFE